MSPSCTPEPALRAAVSFPSSPSASPCSFPPLPLPSSSSSSCHLLHPHPPQHSSRPIHFPLIEFHRTVTILLYYGLLRALSGLPMHTGLASGLPVCLCSLLFPWGLQRPGVCPGAHHRAGVWLFSTSRRLYQPQSSGSAAAPTSQLWHRTPCYRPTAKRLPDPLPTAGWDGMNVHCYVTHIQHVYKKKCTGNFCSAQTKARNFFFSFPFLQSDLCLSIFPLLCLWRRSDRGTLWCCQAGATGLQTVNPATTQR